MEKRTELRATSSSSTPPGEPVVGSAGKHRWFRHKMPVMLDVESGFSPDSLRALEIHLRAAREATRRPVLVRGPRRLISWAKRGDQHITDQRMPLLKLIMGLAAEGVIQPAAHPDDERIEGESSVAELATVALRVQMRHAIAVITQNAELARILATNGGSGAIEQAKAPLCLKLAGDQLEPWSSQGGEVVNDARGGAGSSPDMAKLVRDHHIIVDTSSLMLRPHGWRESPGQESRHLGVEFMLEHLLPAMDAACKPLLISDRVVKELEHHTLAYDEPERRNVAIDALAVVERFKSEGKALITADNDELVGASVRFADPILVQVAARLQHRAQLCFITQDRKLAKSLLDNQRADGKQYRVLRLVESNVGRVECWAARYAREARRANDGRAGSIRVDDAPAAGSSASALEPEITGRNGSSMANTSSSRSTPNKPRKQPSATLSVVPLQPFALATTVRNDPDQPLQLAQLPADGDYVTSAKFGRIKLGEKIAEGGEGSVYATEIQSVVCKVYKPDRLTKHRRVKLELMVSKPVNLVGVCWPLDVCKTDAGEFVGYLMPRVQGNLMRTSMFGKPYLSRSFPSWTREHLVSVAIAVLEAAQRLHTMNILIGDINPRNILVNEDCSVWLIDMDSVQIESFPCPVGEVLYTPPQHQQKNFGTFLRTLEDEQFALATLVFQILFPGKPPYSAMGGDDLAGAIRSGAFAYDKDTDTRPPKGAWGFIWNHLSSQLKVAFIQTFSERGRVPVHIWLDHLRSYRAQIRRGQATADLFPNEPFIPPKYKVIATCPDCPPGSNQHSLNQRFRQMLEEQGRPFICSRCAAVRRLSRVDNTREVSCELRLSPNCLGMFTRSVDAIEGIRARGWPLGCPKCTQAKKEARELRTGYGRGSGAGSRDASPCFVATVAYRDAQAPAVCWLRRYRDQVLRNSAFGRCFIRNYYRFGPYVAVLVRGLPGGPRLAKAGLDAIIGRLKNRYLQL